MFTSIINLIPQHLSLEELSWKFSKNSLLQGFLMQNNFVLKN